MLLSTVALPLKIKIFFSHKRDFTKIYPQKFVVEKAELSFFCLILLSVLLYSHNKPVFCFSVEINCNYVPVGILLKIHLDYPLKQRKEQSKLILCSFLSNLGLLFILGFILLPVLSLLPSKSLWQNNICSVLLTHFFSSSVSALVHLCVIQ